MKVLATSLKVKDTITIIDNILENGEYETQKKLYKIRKTRKKEPFIRIETVEKRELRYDENFPWLECLIVEV